MIFMFESQQGIAEQTLNLSKLVIITIGQRGSFALVITGGRRRMDTGRVGNA